MNFIAGLLVLCLVSQIKCENEADCQVSVDLILRRICYFLLIRSSIQFFNNL